MNMILIQTNKKMYAPFSYSFPLLKGKVDIVIEYCSVTVGVLRAPCLHPMTVE